jgi:hypothetical protein
LTTLFLFCYFPTADTLPPSICAPLEEEIAFIASFAFGCNSGFVSPFRMVHPNQLGERVYGRWMAPFHSSMLRLGSMSLRLSMLFPSVLFSLSFFVSLYLAALELKVPKKVAFIAPFLTIFVAGYSIFDLHHTVSGPKCDFVSRTKTRETQFLHPTLHLFVANRSTPVALSISTLVFYFLLTLIRGKRALTMTSLYLIGFLVSTLAAVQIQAFVGLSVFLCFGFVFLDLKKHGHEVVCFLEAYGLGSILHLPHIIPVLRHVKVVPLWGSYIRSGHYFPFLEYWFDAYGLFPFFAIIFPLFLCNRYERRLVLPIALNFLAAGSFSFQEPLNRRILVFFSVSLPFGAVFCLAALCRLSSKTSFPEEALGILSAISVVIIVTSSASAIGGLYRQVRQSQVVWGGDEIKLAEWIRQSTPKAAVFTGLLMEMSPVSALAGRIDFVSSMDLCDTFGFTNRTFRDELDFFCSAESLNGLLPFVDYFLTMKDRRGICRSVALTDDIWPPETEIGYYVVRKHLRK